jgi:hypothetical protein
MRVSDPLAAPSNTANAKHPRSCSARGRRRAFQDCHDQGADYGISDARRWRPRLNSFQYVAVDILSGNTLRNDPVKAAHPGRSTGERIRLYRECI